MRLLLLLSVLFLGLAGAPLTAQTIFVDPINGDDIGGNGSTTDPYKSLTFALSVALSSNDIELRSGTYQGPDEIFPIVIRDQIDIEAGPGQLPTFNAGGAANAFVVSADITSTTSVAGLQVLNCQTAFFIDVGPRINGLVIEDSAINNFTDNGILIRVNSGANILTIRNCDFIGGLGANHGVNLEVSGNGVDLIGGSVEDCSIASCATGVEVEASAGAVVQPSFFVQRNLISSYSISGLRIAAQAGTSFDATNSANVQGNQINGANIGDTGLLLEALGAGVGNRSATTNGRVSYNTFSGNTNGVTVRTDREISGGNCDLTSDFIANIIANSGTVGVLFLVRNPVALQRNCDPVFGDIANGPVGSGRNTFSGNALNMRLDTDMQNQPDVIRAENNWWSENNTTAILNSIETNGVLAPSITGFLLDTMTGTIAPKSIKAQEIRNVVITAGAQSALVDNPDTDATVGRMFLLVGTVGATPFVFGDGTGLSFVSPQLASGNYQVQIVNPGGQVMTTTLRVEQAGGGGGGSSTGICAVATAAHGGYDSEEVRVLRRLRDDYLSTTQAGRAFTRAYYEHGPHLANYIEEREWARAGTRLALAPMVGVAEALLTWNQGQRFAFGILLLGTFWLFRRRKA